jgi:glycine cleavage system regulatory protein
VSVDADRAADLAATLTAIEGLTVVVEATAEPQVEPGRGLYIELIGNDRPGIIRDISRALAAQRVNIEDLETDVLSAPMSGELLFRARAHVHVPLSVTLESLREQLEALAGELMVDLDVEPVDGE